jgi:hypothetical protein
MEVEAVCETLHVTLVAVVSTGALVSYGAA